MTDPAAGTAATAPDPELDPELAAEQRHIDAAYARLDAMRRAAERVAEGYTEVTRGGTHQARLEREAAEAYTRRRLAGLDIGDAPLCFGRLDLPRRSNSGRDRPLLHRPDLGHRRRPRAAGHRLARARRRAVLPGDRGRADGRRPPPALPDPRPAPHRHRRRGVRRRRRRRSRASPWWGRARCSPRSTRSAPGGCATSSPPSRPSRTKRSAPTSPASSSCRVGPGTGKTAVAPAPRRLPPLHAPQAARVAGRAARRSEPDLPALHRRGAPVARRRRSEPGHARRAQAAPAGAAPPSRRPPPR